MTLFYCNILIATNFCSIIPSKVTYFLEYLKLHEKSEQWEIYFDQ